MVQRYDDMAVGPEYPMPVIPAQTVEGPVISQTGVENVNETLLEVSLGHNTPLAMQR
jgi:hypothetical protein